MGELGASSSLNLIMEYRVFLNILLTKCSYLRVILKWVQERGAILGNNTAEELVDMETLLHDSIIDIYCDIPPWPTVIE